MSEGQRKTTTKAGHYSVHYGGDRSENFDCTQQMGARLSGNSSSRFSASLLGISTFTQEKTGVCYTFGVEVENCDN